ncbi:hypothetical protein BDY21DRAFT_362186 [Lineolata rhizophorae]|uniref:Uncharacterized protein n=1 Tax=Lineolata rhizophorae TaxID=578093 RepID=A0A6A6P7P7_9PEZI|nr:hypothetical protein BDY21DRAFT_362186 [Lineolata rhizophorae]
MAGARCAEKSDARWRGRTKKTPVRRPGLEGSKPGSREGKGKKTRGERDEAAPHGLKIGRGSTSPPAAGSAGPRRVRDKAQHPWETAKRDGARGSRAHQPRLALPPGGLRTQQASSSHWRISEKLRRQISLLRLTRMRKMTTLPRAREGGRVGSRLAHRPCPGSERVHAPARCPVATYLPASVEHPPQVGRHPRFEMFEDGSAETPPRFPPAQSLEWVANMLPTARPPSPAFCYRVLRPYAQSPQARLLGFPPCARAPIGKRDIGILGGNSDGARLARSWMRLSSTQNTRPSSSPIVQRLLHLQTAIGT